MYKVDNSSVNVPEAIFLQSGVDFTMAEHLKYLDKDGQSISLRRWQELIRCPAYTAVADDKIDGCEVSSSWLGVAAADHPETFITKVNYSDNFKKRCYWIWSKTEKMCLAIHAKQVAEMQFRLTPIAHDIE